jgi:isopenicillin N synthase-like dioxygenase
VGAATASAAWDQTAAFFDLPVEAKVGPDNHLLMTDTFPYGYSPFGGEKLDKGKVDVDGAADDEGGGGKAGDMKEMFSVGPYLESAGMPLPRYPAEPPGMAGAWRAYFEAMEGLSASLMQGFALALKLDEDWFAGKVDRHASSLRSLNYPALRGDLAPKPGQMRASAHTDYGVLTILKSGGPGLQVKLRDGQWHDAPHVPEGFIINLGDLMCRWTNDKWLSTPHRVVVPDDLASKLGDRRQSLAYFCNLNMDADVQAIPTCVTADHPAKYPPTRAGEHLMAKHGASTAGILDDSWMKDLTK